MRLPDEYRAAVVYLDRGGPPLGTAFLLQAPGAEDGSMYIVTAGHVVTNQSGLRLRVNTVGGEIGTVPLDEGSWWLPDDIHADVAVALWPSAVSTEGFHLVAIPWSAVADDDFLVAEDVGPGDEVAFVGLFSRAPGKDRNLPILRFGHIARMAYELHLLEGYGGLHKEIEAILVEARSWGGHSGSPAFLMLSPMRKPGRLSVLDTSFGSRSVFSLLGLVSGHLTLPADVVEKNKAESLVSDQEVQVNAGIALVTSAKKIINLITREDVMADLSERRADQKRRDAARADTADTAPQEPPKLTKGEFEAALRKVSRRKASPPDRVG